MVQHLVQNHAQRVVRHNDKSFIVAIQKGHITIVAYLITNFPGLHVDDYDAYESPNINNLKFLLSRNILEFDIESIIAKSENPIALLEFGEKILKREITGITIDTFYELCDRNDRETMQYLMERNFHSNISMKKLLKYVVSQCGNFEIFEYLVKCGALNTVNNIENFFRTVCKHGILEIVKFLIPMIPDISFNGNAAILKASARGHGDVVKFLLDNGVKCDSELLQLLRNDANPVLLKFLN
jgi:hypothetical protein